ncbi:MAG TPA: hypothetical protein VIB00_09845 [Pyrinomonadaceae bacterium]|jgi:hypothetical protein
MKTLPTLLFVITLLLTGLVGETRADLAKPKANKVPAKDLHYSEIAIETDPKANEARLQISQATLKELQAAVASIPNDSQQDAGSITRSSTRTLVAGLSLFLAISFGGVWMVRSGSSRGQKTFAAILIGGALLGGAAVITRGNAGPPPAYRWRGLTKNLNEGRPTYASVMIEVVPNGSGIKLIVPLKPAAVTQSE